MSSSGWIHVNVNVLSETDKAFEFVQIGTKQRFWVPRSVVSDPDDYKTGDKDCIVSIKEWFAEKEGITP